MSSRTAWPRDAQFYFDENTSYRLVEILERADDDSDLVLRHFSKEFPGRRPAQEGDVPWIQHLATKGHWHIITSDSKIRRTPQERAAIADAGFNAFYLTPAWQNFEHLTFITKFLDRWPLIKKAARSASRGEGFSVRPTGKKILSLQRRRSFEDYD